MPLTNYPQGVSSFGMPVIGGGGLLTTGSIFFVNSTAISASDGNLGTEPRKPLATIQAAVNKCTANAGDLIIVGPGHVDTVNSNGALTVNVAGVSIIGLGRGNNRPTINFTTTTSAKMLISGANVAIQNLLFSGEIDALTAPIDFSGGPDCALLDCEYRDGTGQATDVIFIRSASDRTVIRNLVFRGATAAGANTGIVLIGVDDVVIDGLYMDGNFAVGGIDCRNTASVNLLVKNVDFRTRHSADIFIVDTITGSTGQIGPNIYIRLQDNAANVTEACTGATFVYMQPINIVNNAGESSMQTNITATTDA